MRLCSQVAASAVFVAITATAAQSHSPGIGGGEAATLKQGHFTFSTDYEFIKVRPLSDAAMAAAVTPSTHVHSLKSIAAVAAAIAYGVTDDLTVALRLPWVSRTGIREAHVHDPLQILCRFINWGTHQGIGDLTATAQYRFLNNRASGTEAAIILGVETPTGKTSARTDDGDLFDAEFQPGSGSWDGIVGAALSQTLGGPWSTHSSFLYGLTGTGTQNTDLGNRAAYNVALGLPALRRSGRSRGRTRAFRVALPPWASAYSQSEGAHACSQ